MPTATRGEEAGILTRHQESSAHSAEKHRQRQEFYRRHFRLLYQNALNVGLSHEEAEDNAHDTLMETYEKMNVFIPPPEGSFESLLEQIQQDLLRKFQA